MAVPDYVRIFDQALNSARREKSEKSEIRYRSSGQLSSHNSLNSHLPHKGPGLAASLTSLERRCPESIDVWRWQQAVTDGSRFLTQWGEQASALGWTSDDLFGLDEPPEQPHPSYDRLSRFDCLGLVWVLEGRTVTMLSSESAKIKTRTAAVVYRKIVQAPPARCKR